MADKYKYLYKMDTEIAFKNCIIDTSDNVCDAIIHVTEKIIQEATTTTDPDIIGISSVLDAEGEENSKGM